MRTRAGCDECGRGVRWARKTRGGWVKSMQDGLDGCGAGVSESQVLWGCVICVTTAHGGRPRVWKNGSRGENARSGGWAREARTENVPGP